MAVVAVSVLIYADERTRQSSELVAPYRFLVRVLQASLSPSLTSVPLSPQAPHSGRAGRRVLRAEPGVAAPRGRAHGRLARRAAAGEDHIFTGNYWGCCQAYVTIIKLSIAYSRRMNKRSPDPEASH